MTPDPALGRAVAVTYVLTGIAIGCAVGGRDKLAGFFFLLAAAALFTALAIFFRSETQR